MTTVDDETRMALIDADVAVKLQSIIDDLDHTDHGEFGMHFRSVLVFLQQLWNKECWPNAK